MNNKKPALIINVATAKELIHALPDGEMFSMKFYRKAHVCADCNNRYKVTDVCPKCGSHNIITTCETVAQKAVSDPTNATKPGTGKYKGQSAEEAEAKNNVLKYFNPCGADEKGRGVYRSCGFEKIYYLKIRGVEYNIVDAVE